MRSHENLPWLFIKMLPSSNYKSAHKFESHHEVIISDKRANSSIAPSVDRMVKYANLNLVMKSLDLPVTVRSLVSVHSLEKNLVIFPVFTSFKSSMGFRFDIFSVDKKFSSSSVISLCPNGSHVLDLMTKYSCESQLKSFFRLN